MMKSKIELIKNIGNFKITIRKNHYGFSNNHESSFHDYFRCGYVAIKFDKNFKYTHRFCYNNNVEKVITNIIDNSYVHGGITYYEIIDGYIILGFDCCHFCDSKPWQKEPRSFGYVLNEIYKLMRYILKAKRVIYKLRKKEAINIITKKRRK